MSKPIKLICGQTNFGKNKVFEKDLSKKINLKILFKNMLWLKKMERNVWLKENKFCQKQMVKKIC